MDVCLDHRCVRPVPVRVGHLARRQPAEVHLQALARAQVPRAHRARVHRGRRPQGPDQWSLGCRPPLQLHGRGLPGPVSRPVVRPLRQSLGLDLHGLRRLHVHLASGRGRQGLRREIRRREVGRVPGAGEVSDCAGRVLRGRAAESLQATGG